ncbi:AAA family ATPase [Oryzomicrobium sp.]|uniref:BTAD domain-containing putative transcriptional regulator n=1 Tax=Oryzomicrobium sp. TaxID=1911578 RepID=UPI0025CEAE7B|nr:AAA family ATPase [Oryzomicrobium sp.]MCE1241667.1 AAA family ATPase [Oryzomicrobium sp.]
MVSAMREKTGIFNRPGPDAAGESCLAAGQVVHFQSAVNDGLRIRLFGMVSVAAGEAEAPPFRYEKLKGLLAYLAMQPQMPLSRTFLAALFWPDLTADAGRQNLRQALFLLRSVLGDGVIESSRQTVRFMPGRRVMVDALFFEQAARSFSDCAGCAGVASCICRPDVALQEYRGGFAEGLSLPDCPEFERWLVARREGLHRCAVDFMGRYIEWRAAQGAIQEALQWAIRQVDLEPWDEEGMHRLMRLYAESGNPAAGLAHYQRFEKELYAELGIRPGNEIRILADMLRNGQVSTPEIQSGDAEPGGLVVSERRQVTVVFCELTPSCEPEHEDMGELFSARRDELVRQLIQAGGRVVHNHGLSVLAYFGYPRAWEGAALAAARAACNGVRTVSAPDLRCTVAIHTGMATVGEGPEETLCGHVSAAAMALAYAVSPGQVVVSDVTLSQLRGAFLYESLDLVAAPGRPGVQAYRLNRLRTGRHGEPHFGMPGRTVRLVGRKGELGRLLDLWREARRGVPRLGCVLGEAGVGKTFLVANFRRRLLGSEAAVIPLECRREHRNTPLWPLHHWLVRRLPVRPVDSRESVVQRLQQLLGPVTLPPGDLAEAASWLCCPAEESGGEMPRLFVLVASVLVQVCSRYPLSLTVEDMEFADGETLRLIDFLLGQPKTALLVVVTGRRPYAGHAAAETVVLTPLTQPHARALAAACLQEQGGCLPTWVENALVFCEGNPLFIEEYLVMGMRNGGRLFSGGRQLIPATLRDLMMARLDGLGVAKGVVQYAAVIGREFSLTQLAGLCGLRVGEMASYLEPLVEDGVFAVLSDDEDDSDPRLVFRQNLLREAAYQSLSKPVRERLIARAGHMLGFEGDTDVQEVVAGVPATT